MAFWRATRLLGFAAILVALGASLASAKERRIALVIGNGAYTHTARLTNPPHDARLMSRTLRGLGFEVIEQVDATQKQMKRAMTRFSRSLSKAGKDAVGLFYYAGHGVQVAGTNYLLPVDANIQIEGDVDVEAVNANSVLLAMDQAQSRVNFVVLDACRNNPFARSFRSGTSGLARMDAPRGTIVAYATAPGAVAADGAGRNSPYTESLVEAMQRPGVPVELMFKEVRRRVQRLTNDRQTPWESSSLTGNFSFRTGAAVAQGAGPDREVVFWNSIRDSRRPADFDAYLEAYPNGAFAALARIRRDQHRTRVAEAQPDANPRRSGSDATPPQLANLPPPSSSVPVDPCDELAGSPLDPQHVGPGVAFAQIDPTRAIAACREALARSPHIARFAFQYGRALSRARRHQEARVAYEKAANAGSAAAISNLGTLFDKGLGVKKDHRRAFELFSRSARTGFAVGQYNLAAMYKRGAGVKKDFRKAIYWYRRAADQGVARAYASLGDMYWYGEGVRRDYGSAVRLYRLGARKNDTASAFGLGVAYYEGRGVSPDKTAGLRLIRKAAGRGLKAASDYLADKNLN